LLIVEVVEDVESEVLVGSLFPGGSLFSDTRLFTSPLTFCVLSSSISSFNLSMLSAMQRRPSRTASIPELAVSNMLSKSPLFRELQPGDNIPPPISDTKSSISSLTAVIRLMASVWSGGVGSVSQARIMGRMFTNSDDSDGRPAVISGVVKGSIDVCGKNRPSSVVLGVGEGLSSV
jgi:hypothetical protein